MSAPKRSRQEDSEVTGMDQKLPSFSVKRKASAELTYLDVAVLTMKEIRKIVQPENVKDVDFVVKVLRDFSEEALLPVGFAGETAIAGAIGTSPRQQADSSTKLWIEGQFSQHKRAHTKQTSSSNAGRTPSDVKQCASEDETSERIPLPMPPSHAEQAKQLLQNLTSWDFDLPSLTKATRGHPLPVIGWAVLHDLGLATKFSLDPVKTTNFLCALEEGYHNNPYHNAEHAADVTQTLYSMMVTKGLSGFFSPLEQLASILAALVHDVGHDGFNNSFHVRTGSKIALQHNDISVLENHHLVTAFTLLKREELNFLENLDDESSSKVRATVVKLVLGTDMTHHFNQMEQFKSMCSKNGPDPTNWSDSDKLHLLVCCMHAADISNPTKPLHISKIWTERCLSEFFNQGDEEKKRGLKVTAGYDRDAVQVPDSQIGFINYVVVPQYEALSALFEGFTVQVQSAKSVCSFWEKEKENKSA